MTYAASSRARLLGALLLGLLGPACLGSSDSCEGDDCEACSPGEERCECYGNGTCNDGLECHSDLCVDPDADDDDGDDDDGSDGDDDSAKGDGGSSGGGSGDEDEGSGSSARDDGANDDGADDDGANDDGADDADDGSAGSGSTDDGASGAGADDGAADDGADDAQSDDDASGSTDEPGGSTTDDGAEPNGEGSPSGGAAPSGSPVANYGQLSVSGTRVVGDGGQVVQLKGASSMWLNWEDDGFAEDLAGLRTMRDTWKLSVIRAAMGIEPEGAYMSDPDKARAQVQTIVENAIELGVYVIIDWHAHEPHLELAQGFFSDMAELYGDTPNVIYELYNEPLDLSWSGELKPYHEAVRDTIRAHDPDNLIILGTPNWDQDVEVAAAAPLSGSNLLYALHFYSCSHGAPYRAKAQQALDLGLPLFVSEWGAATADGITTDSTCIAEAAAWHDWMDENAIGWAAWKLDNCTDATCFFIDASVPTDGSWSDAQLNGLHPQFAIERMQRQPETVVVPEEPEPSVGECTASGSCVSGGALDCTLDGELIERDCSACSLLPCTGCCSSVGYFGAISQPTFAIEYDLVESFEPSSTGATLTMDFDFATFPSADEQIGAIAFALEDTQWIDPASLSICMNVSDPNNVQVSLEDGASGCLYWMYLLDGCAFPYDLVSCWGDWETLGQDDSRQINVRIASTTSTVKAMTVTSISW